MNLDCMPLACRLCLNMLYPGLNGYKKSATLFVNMFQLVAVLILVFVVSASAASLQLWQGLEHTWKRSIIGFEVPHRFGDFANRIINSTSATPFAHFTFVPGLGHAFNFLLRLYISYNDNSFQA